MGPDHAWDLTTLGTTGALPSGTINRIGMMTTVDSRRFDYFEVSGTAIPEPSAALLGALGLLALLRRRR